MKKTAIRQGRKPSSLDQKMKMKHITSGSLSCQTAVVQAIIVVNIPKPLNHIFSKLKHYHSSLGWKGVAAFCMAKLRRRESVFSARIPNIKFPVSVRLATTDVSVLKQVLLEKHYNFPLQFSPRTIIDAGANIGLSAVYFANHFPGAQILAIEPEFSNFQLLVRNTAPYPNIKPMHAALWHSEGSISLFDPGSGNHGFQTSELQTETNLKNKSVRATTVEAILRDSGWETLDLLKLDIEGSEKEVFDACAPWSLSLATLTTSHWCAIGIGVGQSNLSSERGGGGPSTHFVLGLLSID